MTIYLRGSSQYTILCLDVCDPCDSISAWIYRCDDTTRPGIARQRIISDKDDIADLQCFDRGPAGVVTRADIPEASGSRTYLLAVERRATARGCSSLTR
ncbi:hypothetical protein EVAR_88449_1 [Eumeta japonica]|uniref:Uncharacterized protein n=1 Tax=Eumeta variegata TaxID=151549 RepID=A0A4C1XVQ9_EUMVA|nr:hypothetical protein EVAR_88449_1 [Eumeta japonica]